MEAANLSPRRLLATDCARRFATALGLAALLTVSAACGSGANPPTEPTDPAAVANLVQPTPASDVVEPSPVANSEGPGPSMNFGTAGDVGKLVAFLTGPVLYTDNSEGSVTAGKELAVSYYSTPKYWGGYICQQGDSCAYTIAPWQDGHQWPADMESPAGRMALERADATAGADIYDIATWQIALALAAKDAAATGVDAARLQSLVETQNVHLTDPKYRAVGDQPYLYGYVDKLTEKPQAYYFRMTPTDFMVTDPLWTDPAYKSLVTNDPGVEAKNQGKTSWTDWKPITGENAWAWFLGPIQADAIKNSAQGYIPFNATSMQNAIKVLDAFSRMQTGIGAFYYSTGPKAEGNQGYIPDGEVSVENNFSALGGLRVLQAELEATKANDSSADKAAIDAALAKIDVMLNGGTTVGGYHTDGLLSFMYNGAFDPASGFFTQGGIATLPRENTGGWVKAGAGEPKAVDVNTWGISALGPATVDAWWGPGAAYKVWENVRPWGGYFGPSGDKSGPIWGVGYSNEDANGIMSAEWTAGAITMLHMLTTYYSANPGGITPQQLASLEADKQSMLASLTKMRSDNYSAAGFNDMVPAEFMAQPPEGQQAYLYGSKRYDIPFGWFANPLPSTCSSSWPVMLHYTFNPFQPGGSFKMAALPKPATKDITGGGGGPTPTSAASGPLQQDVIVTVSNEIKDATLAAVDAHMVSGGTQTVARVPLGQSMPNVTIPKGTQKLSITWNKTPENNNTWWGACSVDNPSSLSTGATLHQVWKDSNGVGQCTITK